MVMSKISGHSIRAPQVNQGLFLISWVSPAELTPKKQKKTSDFHLSSLFSIFVLNLDFFPDLQKQIKEMNTKTNELLYTNHFGCASFSWTTLIKNRS